jgi:hypothetical protein
MRRAVTGFLALPAATMLIRFRGGYPFIGAVIWLAFGASESGGAQNIRIWVRQPATGRL